MRVEVNLLRWEMTKTRKKLTKVNITKQSVLNSNDNLPELIEPREKDAVLKVECQPQLQPTSMDQDRHH